MILRMGYNQYMDKTGQYYRDNSQEFFDSTVNAEVTPLYEHFLKYVPEGGSILDLGCGSGRDTGAFKKMGFDVDAVDGSKELCELASEYTGIPVRCMDFMDLSEIEKYDAIWACASLLHVPSKDLPVVLSKMRSSLKPQGIMYISFKFGDHEGERDGRFFNDMTSERFSAIIDGMPNLTKEEEWYSEDVRRGKNVRWFNVILRKA